MVLWKLLPIYAWNWNWRWTFDWLQRKCQHNALQPSFWFWILKTEFESIPMIALLSLNFLMLLQEIKSMIYQKKVPDIFLQLQLITYIHQSTSHFLPTNMRHLRFATKFLINLHNHVLQHIHGITWNRTKSTIIVLLDLYPFPLEFLPNSLQNHYQYIVTTNIKNKVLKKPLGKRVDPFPLNQST